MGILRTPEAGIPIGEVILEKNNAIALRIKKPGANVYEKVLLDQLLKIIVINCDTKQTRYIQTPVQHITIGELIYNSEKSPVIRIKKAGAPVYEIISIGQLLNGIFRIAMSAA